MSKRAHSVPLAAPQLDRLALDPVSRQLEEVWKFIKKYLSEGPRFDADSAAGFKK